VDLVGSFLNVIEPSSQKTALVHDTRGASLVVVRRHTDVHGQGSGLHTVRLSAHCRDLVVKWPSLVFEI
jgi:hypothetical protein